MSTRGTYKIDGKLLYNHSDNYPEGAAQHLHSVIKNGEPLSYVNMIRNTEWGANFQPTESVYDGPAGYYYVIKGRNIEAFQIPFESNELKNYELKSIFSGTIAEFINTYIAGTDTKNEILEFDGKLAARVFWVNKLESDFGNGFNWLLRNDIGNASNLLLGAAKLAVLLGGHDQQIINYNTYVAPILAERYGHSNPSYFIV